MQQWLVYNGDPSTSTFTTFVDVIRKSYAKVKFYFMFDLDFCFIGDAQVGILFRSSSKNQNVHVWEGVIENSANL